MSQQKRSVFFVLTLSVLVLTSLAPFISQAQKKDPKVEKELKVVIVFSGEQGVKEKLDKLAENISLTAKEFRTTEQIAYWDNEGKELITKRLYSEGYYNPVIGSTTSNDEEGLKQEIKFDVSAGPRYMIDKQEIIYKEGGNNAVLLPKISDLPTLSGKPAIAEDILDNQAYIITKIEENNCLLSLRIYNEVTINHRSNTISISYVVDAGHVAAISKVDFSGMVSVKKPYLHKVVGIGPDPCFKRSKILKARHKLQTTGLFSSTTPDIPSEVDEDGKVPVIFKLKERKHRSVKAGVSYGRDLGLGLNAGWEHRNFFSNGEAVTVNAFANQKEQFGSANYIEPYFLRDDQKLKISLTADNSTLKAYDSREGKFYAGLEREMVDDIDAGFGGKVSVSRIKEKSVEDNKQNQGKNFVLLSSPFYMIFDRRDSVVDARKGYYLRGDVEPFYDVNRSDNTFVRHKIQARYYTKMNFHKPSVIAVRAALGSIFGKKASEIPATERFFVGGGSSVRGYAYQTVGPYDIVRKAPLGGKSFIETSVEYRYMRSDNIGVAIFYDSGNVHRKHLPNFKKIKFFNGVGFGIRYNTDFGPIRADIAFPLKRRKGIDDRFQFYFGIGQSF